LKSPKVVTIDGPAGAGKSTVAKEIAKRFGYVHLDSGALYRAVGYFCKLKGVDPTKKEDVLKAIKNLNVELLPNGRVLLNGRDVTEEIRTPEGGVLASQVAQFPEVREFVVKLLRKMAAGKKIVIDGRDAGTYIFPEAELKIYLTASPEERARRRYRELREKGFNVTLEEVLREVIERDRKDESRKFAPLKVPEGAIVIDTTNKNLKEVLREVSDILADS